MAIWILIVLAMVLGTGLTGMTLAYLGAVKHIEQLRSSYREKVVQMDRLLIELRDLRRITSDPLLKALWEARGPVARFKKAGKDATTVNPPGGPADNVPPPGGEGQGMDTRDRAL